MLLFGRFATSAQYAALEGQPGAAAAILQNLRGGFTTTPAIAANRNMDVVHRTVGKPGVILVGEGSPTRLPSLLAAEKKRISRIASQVPIYDFQVGDAEGQVPIKQLNRKIMKLPRNLKGQAVAELNYPPQRAAPAAADAQGTGPQVGPDAEGTAAPHPLGPLS